MKLVYCQATWREDFEDTIRCIERVSLHVDATIIVYDQTLTEEQKAWFNAHAETYRLEAVYHEFRDNLPEMRNAYLNRAKEIGAEWVLVSDPDEFFDEKLLERFREVIEGAEKQGYNMLGIHAVDQFDNVEWLDNLDLLKEAPGGYRETDFWKPLLLFKLYADTHYEGVGATKNVHETLTSVVLYKQANLPKELFYTHRKSALRIWRNAARNMFISGGGDNVGGLNIFWSQLRDITTSLGITTWPQFEEAMKKGIDDPRFKTWLVQALQVPPTSWGTETRETAKLYFALHSNEVTEEIKRSILNPPKLTPQIEVENYVTRCYFQILGRHPDEHGKANYVKSIMEGRMKQDELPNILKQSLEYHEKFGPPTGVAEKIRINIPVDVDVRISEDLLERALSRSRMYWDVIRPRFDLSKFLESFIRHGDKKLFYDWFYANRPIITPRKIGEWIEEFGIKPNSIALCIMGYHDALPMILENVDMMRSFVDEIHVQGDDFTEEDIERLNEWGCEAHIEPWTDDFSDYKNKCIAPARTDWVLVCDHDEIPTKDLAEHVREVVEKSDRGRLYNMVSFDVIDERTFKGQVLSATKSQSGKALLHLNVKDAYYGNPHIWLKPDYYPWKVAKAPMAYRHIKEEGTELPRSARNVFLGGGGDSVREKNPSWVELRKLTDELGIKTWKAFDDYLKEGKIDIRVLDVLKNMAEMPWKDSELKDPLRYYYLLHPEEE